MKVQINFERFKKVINKAVNACTKTGSNQVLKGILIEASKNELLIRSTNIDIGFESSLPCKTETEGKFLILGEVLNRLLGSINSRSDIFCEISFENNICSIVIDKHNLKLKTLSFDIFPALPKVEGVDICVDNNIFLSGLKSVVYSVAKSEIKPEISGVYVKFSGNNLFFVATDAYRLAEKKINLEEEVVETSFILPEKNVKELFKILDNDFSGNLSLTISKNSLQIKENNTFFVSRLIEGNFPNYTQILPQSPTSFAVFLKEELFKSLKIVSFFSDKTLQINLNILETGTEIEVNNNEVGSTKEFLNSTLKGDPFTIKLNSKYLEEFLQNIPDTSVVLKYTAQNKAIVVQGISNSDYTYLLMPSYR